MKVTLERFECDICQKEAVRYTVQYPDGTKILDRCEKHSKKLLALKDEPGDFAPVGNHRRTGIQLVTARDIARKRTGE